MAPTDAAVRLRQQSPNRPRQRDPNGDEDQKLQIRVKKANTNRHDGAALENSERGLPISSCISDALVQSVRSLTERGWGSSLASAAGCVLAAAYVCPARGRELAWGG